MTAAPDEIALEGGDALTEASAEVARIWVTDGAGSSVWIRPELLEDPRVFGYLMADTIRHAARAYAATYDLPEDAALQAIVDGVAEELSEQFNTITTIQKGRAN